jgi:hypothetical protein
MAEVLGPFGYCFGAISFIFSTVPTVAKASDAYLKCVGHFNSLRLRIADLEARYWQWENTWKDFDLGQYEESVNATRDDLEELKKDINHKIRKSLKSDWEKERWKRRRTLLLRGIFDMPTDVEILRRRPKVKHFLNTLAHSALQLLPNENADFHRSLGYAIWEKDIIEGWLTRMKSNIEAMERLSDTAWKKQTARRYNASPDEGRVKETIALQSSRGQLKILADALYDRHNTSQQAHGWALCLPAPAKDKDIISWKYVARRDFDLRFRVDREETVDYFCLRVVYERDNEETYARWDHVQNAIRERIDPSHNATPPTTNGAECSMQNSNVSRSHSLEELFREKPELFREATKSWHSWRADRLDLVRGLLNWTILLWDTRWTRELCSCRLQVEKDPTAPSIVLPILTAEKYHGCEHKGICLRNLGIALAEIFLTTPFRLTSGTDTEPGGYQQWINGQWTSLLRDRIYDQILDKTDSGHLRNAISFCLEEEGPLADEAFEAGFMFGYIDEIYKP